MSAPMNRLARMNPAMSACQPLMRELASQNGAANTRVSTSGTMAMSSNRPMPSEAGSKPGVMLHASGHGNGAFQPPKNRVTVRAEMMNTFTYSAKKKKPK